MQRDVLLIAEMIDAATQAQSLVADADLPALMEDRQRRDALLWNFTVLGEAASRVTDEVKQRFPELPWEQPTRLGNRIVHGYWSIDLEILHTAATQQTAGPGGPTPRGARRSGVRVHRHLTAGEVPPRKRHLPQQRDIRGNIYWMRPEHESDVGVSAPRKSDAAPRVRRPFVVAAIVVVVALLLTGLYPLYEGWRVQRRVAGGEALRAQLLRIEAPPAWSIVADCPADRCWTMKGSAGDAVRALRVTYQAEGLRVVRAECMSEAEVACGMRVEDGPGAASVSAIGGLGDTTEVELHVFDEESEVP
jgi:uncharacterized protein with HEPN domain